MILRLAKEGVVWEVRALGCKNRQVVRPGYTLVSIS